MAMPKFPYAQGGFFGALNAYYQQMKPADRATEYGLMMADLVADSVQDLATNTRVKKGLTKGQVDHFIDDWLTPQAGGKSKIFQNIPVDHIDRVLREGFRRAFQEALLNPDADGPLPITALWICNEQPGKDKFEIVTCVNPNVTVVVLVVTPPPDHHAPHTGAADRIRVTRIMRDAADITNTKQRLQDMDAPSDQRKIMNPANDEAGAGEVGTYRIWT